MSDIEKRARELLAAHLPKGSGFWRAPLLDHQYPADYFPDTYQAAIKAIACALTPPEGYVAAPEDPSLAMTVAGQLFGLTPNQACAVYQTMLAARPEVP